MAKAAALAADVLTVWTRLGGHRVEPSSQGRRDLVQIAFAFVATFRSPLSREVTMEPAKVIVLNNRQRISWNQVAAAPNGRLFLRSPAVFKPHTLDLLSIATRCG